MTGVYVLIALFSIECILSICWIVWNIMVFAREAQWECDDDI